MRRGRRRRSSDVPAALDKVVAFLRAQIGGKLPTAVGHRVVHGGPDYSEPTVVSEAVLDRLERFVPLAPLHQPNNLGANPRDFRAAAAPLAGRLLRYRLPQRPSRRCRSLCDSRTTLYAEGVRRYGFHGLSYEYIARRLGEVAPEIAKGRVVVAHLGSGASMCAISAGKSLESTMGFTALDGLPMGTRPGQLDAGDRALPHEREGDERQGDRALSLQRLRSQGPFGHQQRREGAAREPGSAREAGARLLHLPDRALYGNARRRDGRHRRLRVHGGHRRERAGHSRGGGAAPLVARPRARRARRMQRASS